MTPISGGCFCGKLRYEASVDESRIIICHCRDCQLFSGSAYRLSAWAEPGAFEVTRGTPRQLDKTADSGKTRRMLYCGDCGSHLCSMPGDASEEGAFVSIRLATADTFHSFEPVAEIYTASRVPWLEDMPGIASFEGMPG